MRFWGRFWVDPKSTQKKLTSVPYLLSNAIEMASMFDPSCLDQWKAEITPELNYTKRLLNYACKIVESNYTRNAAVSRSSFNSDVLTDIRSEVDGLACLNINDADISKMAKICYSRWDDALFEESLREWKMMEMRELLFHAIETTRALLHTLSEKIVNNPNLKEDRWSTKARLTKFIDKCAAHVDRFHAALETRQNENLRSKPIW
jgi:hypothetical protein